MTIDFESKPVYGHDDNYIKTKIKKTWRLYDCGFS